MKKLQSNYFRNLAIAPSTKGFGFAVLEGEDSLVDWGVKSIKRESKNADSVKKIRDLIAQYTPGILILEDVSVKGSRRSARIRKLAHQIIKMSKNRKVGVKLYSRDQLMKAFIINGEKTKHALAEIIAKRFPEELGASLPPKRKAWESEDVRMNIFDAVALVLALRQKKMRENPLNLLI